MSNHQVSADVIVIGAGPVGLWLTQELHLQGVSVLVLERAAKRHDRSRAMTMQPRTVEVLASRGFADDMLATGQRVESGHYAMLSSRLDYTPLESPFPFIVSYPQLTLEERLESYLLAQGVPLRRGHSLTDLRRHPDAVEITVAGPDGEYSIKAQYVVGCDGAAGATRMAAGIDVDDTPDTITAFHAELRLDAPPARLPLSHHGPDGAFLCYPLPNGEYRLAGIDPERMTTPRTAPLELEEVRETMRRVAGSDFGLHSPVWMRRLGNAARQANQYLRDRVMVAGDAAHSHWPMGGIGLNLGIQDAHNLGWKLAAVLRHGAPTLLLDTYHSERHPVGARAIEQVRAQSYLVGVTSPEGQAMRSVFSRMIEQSPDLNLTLAQALSGLDIRYAGPAEAHPLVGRRIDDVSLERDAAPTLFAAMRDGQWLLLDRADAPRPVPDLDDIRQVWTLPHRSDRLGAASRVLVRPDGHVAWAADASESEVKSTFGRQLHDLRW